MWDKEWNSHLFMARAIREAEALFMMVADHSMVMALPKNIPTLESMSMKNWTRPDNVFCSANMEAMLVSSMTDPQLRGPGTDHVPILTTLEFLAACTTAPLSYNFQAMDWDKFNDELVARLTDIPIPAPIRSETGFHEAVGNLMGVIQDTIRTTVHLSTPSPHSKQWWNEKLEGLKKEKDKLSSLSYHYQTVTHHASHDEHRRVWNWYSEEIANAKREHWDTFLANMSYGEIWVANHYISSDSGNGGKTHVPTLYLHPLVGLENPSQEAATNKDKSAMLTGLMFPRCPHPLYNNIADDYQYDDQLPELPDIIEEQIYCHLAGLSPYKAPRPDRVPNIVWKSCAKLTIPYLVHIFRASLLLGVYPGQWCESITCVLHKPGKARYDIPKAYRPVALLDTIAKPLSAIVTEGITHLTAAQGLLPANHFRGCPSCTTTNSLHLLVDTIKLAWCKKQVALVLFLDIKRAFLHAVTARLLHNMRRRSIPKQYVIFVSSMLTGCKTRLRFDDYTSDWFELDNGIGQGDPLSMILYLFYNVDILDIAHR